MGAGEDERKHRTGWSRAQKRQSGREEGRGASRDGSFSPEDRTAAVYPLLLGPQRQAATLGSTWTPQARRQLAHVLLGLPACGRPARHAAGRAL